MLGKRLQENQIVCPSLICRSFEDYIKVSQVSACDLNTGLESRDITTTCNHLIEFLKCGHILTPEEGRLMWSQAGEISQ